MAELYIGTSGYAYREWRGRFYPARLPTSQMLRFYSQHLPSVETNYTFYRLPTPTTVEAWLKATPAQFKFALLAHQRITHLQKLENSELALRRFLQVATQLALADRLGPIFFQLPPEFACDLQRLETFLGLRPRAARFAFHFQHPSWYSDAVYALLRRHQTALALVETDQAAPPEVLTADFIYLRLQRAAYSEAELKLWKNKLDTWRAAGHDVYAYFKPGEASQGPAYAQRLLAL